MRVTQIVCPGSLTVNSKGLVKLSPGQMVAGQKAALGRVHAGQTVTVLVSGATLAVEFGDGDVQVIRRTSTQPVRSNQGQRPRTATSIS
jgi:hypothetical protein